MSNEMKKGTDDDDDDDDTHQLVDYGEDDEEEEPNENLTIPESTAQSTAQSTEVPEPNPPTDAAEKEDGEDEEEGVIQESPNSEPNQEADPASPRKPKTPRGYKTQIRPIPSPPVIPMSVPIIIPPVRDQNPTPHLYIHPRKRAQQLQHMTTPQHSAALQRETWEALKKTIHGVINRLNTGTVKPLIHSLFQNANLLRGRGIFARSLIRAAVTSPPHSHVYAALVAVVNTKLPELGELVVTRCIISFRRYYKRRDKMSSLAICAFIGNLFNQNVVYELLALQILTVLLDGDPNDDSVEIAVRFLQVIGKSLLEKSPKGVLAVMERVRNLVHEGDIGKRVQYSCEQLIKIRGKDFDGFPTVLEELDLVEEEDQITFELGLDEDHLEEEKHLDVFSVDDNYEEKEEVWKNIQLEILGDGNDSDDDDDDDDGEASTDSDSSGTDLDQDSDHENENNNTTSTALVTTTDPIQDLTETDLIDLRRKIYLTIMSSASFEECAHKLAKTNIPPSHTHELINMIIECCSQERTFLRYYGLISQRFCLLESRWRVGHEVAFGEQYDTIHRYETNKLRNVAKLFAHLIHTDSVSWSVFERIHLNEEETTSSSRIFIKILVQEMAETLGIMKLKHRFGQETMEEAPHNFKGMFPRDNPRNTRYAINFFTSIGLGPLTDGMRDYLKNAPKLILEKALELEANKGDHDDSDETNSTSSSSLSDTSRSSSSSSSFSSGSDYSSDSYSTSSSTISRRRSRGKERRRDHSRSSSYSSASTISFRKGKRGRRTRSSSRSPSRSDSDSDSSGYDNRNRRDRHRRRGRRSYSSSSSQSRSKSPPSRTRTELKPPKSPIESVEKGRTKKSNDSRYKSDTRNTTRKPDSPLSRNEDKRSKQRSRSYSSSRSPSPDAHGRNRSSRSTGRRNGDRKRLPGKPDSPLSRNEDKRSKQRSRSYSSSQSPSPDAYGRDRSSRSAGRRDRDRKRSRVGSI